MTVRLVVEGHGVAEGEHDSTMLELCDEAGIPMDTACGGFAACNSCRVRVVSGAEHLSPVVEEEEAFLDAPDQRLGCQARVRGVVHVVLDSGM